MSLDSLILPGLLTLVIVLAAAPIVWRLRAHDRMVRKKLEHAKELGSNETVSLHPKIDEGLCIGCEECVRGCPEQDVILTYKNKATVVDATECVGHGICERVCPVAAIILVVGTEKRGLELPRLTEHFETNVPGLYVVGELGGMGLIRNAIWQSTQAMKQIAAQKPKAPPGGVQVLIAGAGPAGLASAISAKAAKLSFRVVEQGEIGGSMLHYPRRKLVMTHPGELPGVGPFPFKEVEKEPLVAFWKTVIQQLQLTIETGTTLTKVTKQDGGHLLVETTKGTIAAANVVLALGRRGSPRRLEVPGEVASKVLDRLIEPEQFDSRRCLVVGGGTAALETALSLSERPGAVVTLCHRREAFAGARAGVIERFLSAEKDGKVEVLRNAKVTAVEPERVLFEVAGQAAERPNDFVFVMIGGTPPFELLKSCGVNLETKFAAPLGRVSRISRIGRRLSLS
jgi:thioredoxin reductase/Pyruvate/2-oxoacid:ferredoxin oxidoreductase delta subunit